MRSQPAAVNLECRMKVAEPEPGRMPRSPARPEPGGALLLLICTSWNGVGGMLVLWTFGAQVASTVDRRM